MGSSSGLVTIKVFNFRSMIALNSLPSSLKCSESLETFKRLTNYHDIVLFLKGFFLYLNSYILYTVYVLPLDEAVASRAVFVIVSGSDVRAGANAFGASYITRKR